MSSPAETARPGLRERKKTRTRATIRAVALRLFHEQGYQATTVEQIAEAAEVSPSTFFRYFPTKEALVLSDDLDPVMMRALEDQPPGLGPFAAIRGALRATLEALTPEELAREQQRFALVLAVPELRGALYDEFGRTIEMLAGGLAARAGREAGDFAVQAFAGAVVGAMLAVVPGTWSSPEGEPASSTDFYTAASAALDFLESGMSLR